jgi:Ca-activated chloride channel homolog
MHRILRVQVIVFAALLLLGCQTTPPRDPGAIAAKGTLATPLLLVGGERTVYARIRLEAQARDEAPTGPVNVALCIDTSGSMVGAAIKEARRAAVEMIARMNDGDRLAVITFNTTTEVVLPSTELDDDVRAEVTEKVAALEALGTTDLQSGLEAAVTEVRSSFVENGINRVVLLGDGIPNHAEQIESIAQGAAASGIPITTLGLGLDYDEVLMGKIAELTGGRFRYVASADKVAGFFQEELLRLRTVYARGTNVRLTAGPGVQLLSVVGAPSPPYNGVAEVPIGDIARGETRDIVVRMSVTPRKADVPIELLDAVVSFDDGVDNGGALQRRVYFGAFTSADEIEVSKARNKEVELAAALAEAGATTLSALALARQNQYVRAREILTKGAEAARAQTKATPSAELEKQAADMEAVAADMPAVDPAPPAQAEGYQFSDDEMVSPRASSPAAESLPEPAARRLKETHQKAYEHTH